jgi:hypothetical protein
MVIAPYKILLAEPIICLTAFLFPRKPHHKPMTVVPLQLLSQKGPKEDILPLEHILRFY